MLHNETDLNAYLNAYLSAVRDERYTVFFAAKEGGTAYAGEQQERLMEAMGLGTP